MWYVPDTSGSTVPLVVTVTSELYVVGTFQRKNYPLTITIVGEGTVTETVIPQKVTEYPFQTMVELSAIPAIIANEIWEFSGWNGDATGADNPITIEITSEKSINATFIKIDINDAEVYNIVTGRIWMDRNLGASRVATSSTDAQAYGDLYQWGRGTDGHEKRNSTTTSILSNTNQPGHGSFISAPNPPYDWRNPQNNNLWEGVDGVNNPCPSGFRIPTQGEWDAERLSWISNNAAGAFASPLKLAVAGLRYNNSPLSPVGSYGVYWSSSVSGNDAWHLGFDSSYPANTFNFYPRAYGGSVRCIKD